MAAVSACRPAHRVLIQQGDAGRGYYDRISK